MRRLLPLLLPALLAAASPDAPPETSVVGADTLPSAIAAQCTASPNASSLVHLNCGDGRLVVAQLRTVAAPVHDEVVDSLMDLVSGPSTRTRPATADADLLITRVVQRRDTLEKSAASIVLVVTSRRSSGHTVACVSVVDGRRRTAKAQARWCDEVTAALLPPPAAPPPATRIEVDGPADDEDDLDGP